MTTSADVYGIIPKNDGGYVLAKTNFKDGVEAVTTPQLASMKRKDPTLHFVSFAFVEIDMMQQYFTPEKKLASHIRHHLVPAGIWGSIKNNRYVWMELDGSDFRKFEYEMTTQDEFYRQHLCFDGISMMGQKDAAKWCEDMKFAEKEGGEE